MSLEGFFVVVLFILWFLQVECHWWLHSEFLQYFHVTDVWVG